MRRINNKYSRVFASSQHHEEGKTQLWRLSRQGRPRGAGIVRVRWERRVKSATTGKRPTSCFYQMRNPSEERMFCCCQRWGERTPEHVGDRVRSRTCAFSHTALLDRQQKLC